MEFKASVIANCPTSTPSDPVLSVASIKSIKYKDEEGEAVTIAREDHFTLLMEEYLKTGATKITVHIDSMIVSPPTSPKQLMLTSSPSSTLGHHLLATSPPPPALSTDLTPL